GVPVRVQARLARTEAPVACVPDGGRGFPHRRTRESLWGRGLDTQRHHVFLPARLTIFARDMCRGAREDRQARGDIALIEEDKARSRVGFPPGARRRSERGEITPGEHGHEGVYVFTPAAPAVRVQGSQQADGGLVRRAETKDGP